MALPQYNVTPLHMDELPTDNKFSAIPPTLRSFQRPESQPYQLGSYSHPPPPPQPVYQHYPSSQQMYYPPPQQQYHPVPQQMYYPPQQQYSQPLPQQVYYPPPQQQYQPPPQQVYYPPPQQQYPSVPQQKPSFPELGKPFEIISPTAGDNQEKHMPPERFPGLYHKQWDTPSENSENNIPSFQSFKDLQSLPGLDDMDPKKTIKQEISNLYHSIQMTKTHEIQNPKLSIFKAVVDPLTSGPDVKYLVAIVPTRFSEPLGTTVPLADLDWINFQTRSTMKPNEEFGGFKLRPQTYAIPKQSILHSRIKCEHEDDKKWTYKSKHVPAVIEILIQKENESFAQEGTIISALELFQTIVKV